MFRDIAAPLFWCSLVHRRATSNHVGAPSPRLRRRWSRRDAPVVFGVHSTLVADLDFFATRLNLFPICRTV
jgi:hypothetical protein